MAHGENYKYHGTTSIIGILKNEKLENWFKRTPELEIEERSNIGKEIGSDVHILIDLYFKQKTIKTSTNYTQEVTFAYKSFEKFLLEHPYYQTIESEFEFDCEEYLFSGCIDWICLDTRDDSIIVWDWKTSKQKSKSFDYQLSMYIRAWELLTGKKVKEGRNILLSKKEIKYVKCRPISKEKIDDIFDNICKPLIAIYNYQNKPKVLTNDKL